MASFDLSSVAGDVGAAAPDYSTFIEDPAMGAYGNDGMYSGLISNATQGLTPIVTDAASTIGSSLLNPSIGTALLAGGLATGAGSLAKGVLGASAASNAAETQANAANSAAQVQWNQFLATQKNLQPYIDLGTNAIPKFTAAAGDLAAPIDLSNLENLPGYKFVRDQGLQATQNGFAAQGLGTSGAAIKGAGQYAENLANTFWPTYFNSQLAQKQQQYNQLTGPITIGGNAASNLGSLGKQTADSATGLTTSGVAATAAGGVGQANAIGTALNSAGGAGSSTALLLALNNAGLFGAPSNG